MTTYEQIYNRALRKLTDPTLLDVSEEELEDTLYGYLMSAVAHSRKCVADLSDRDEELKCFNADLLDVEQEILAVNMLREWLDQRLNSATNILQVFAGKETKFFSQAQHVKELVELDERLKIEAQKLARDYTYSAARGYVGWGSP